MGKSLHFPKRGFQKILAPVISIVLFLLRAAHWGQQWSTHSFPTIQPQKLDIYVQ